MQAQKRQTIRRNVAQAALVLRDDGSVVGPCTMVDVSAGGARLKTPPDTNLPDSFVLQLSKLNAQLRRRCSVAWRRGDDVGIRFLST